MANNKKIRADLMLFEKGLTETRTKAQALILAGKVYVGQKRINKPGTLLLADESVVVRSRGHKWVGRGGVKLEAALKAFSLNPEDRVIADIGASSGGFTDVILAYGAAKVYAIDVGRGQLHNKLRSHPKVVCLEKTNARYLTRRHIQEPLQAITCDVSFIGIEKVLPAAIRLTDEQAWLVTLVKPQFQLGRGKVAKGGVVRDTKLHEEACDYVAAWLEKEMKWRVLGITPSPIEGAKGNKEFLIAAIKT